MGRAGLDEDLGRAAPDHHDPVDLLARRGTCRCLRGCLRASPACSSCPSRSGRRAASRRRGRTRPSSGAPRASCRRSARGAGRRRARRHVPRRCRRRRGTGPTRRRRCRRGRRCGTKSRISGERWSVRLPSRIVAIWVSDPIGEPMPRRASSVPAMSVVATAPRPTVSTPRRPSAGAIVRGVAIPAAYAPDLALGGSSSPARTIARMADYEMITFERQDNGVAWVTLNRPKVHNAFNSRCATS